jgi:hypothetical protein
VTCGGVEVAVFPGLAVNSPANLSQLHSTIKLISTAAPKSDPPLVLGRALAGAEYHRPVAIAARPNIENRLNNEYLSDMVIIPSEWMFIAKSAEVHTSISVGSL